jgi:Tol biopolymer transport system component
VGDTGRDTVEKWVNDGAPSAVASLLMRATVLPALVHGGRSGRARRVVLVGAVSLVLSIVLVGIAAVRPTSAELPQPGGMIAFSLDTTGTYENRDIWLIRANGSGLRRLTWTTVSETSPAWSPDGKRLAFTLIQGEPLVFTWAEVWLMRSDGGGRRRLTPRKDGDAFNPSWSPDGREIVYASNRRHLDAHNPPWDLNVIRLRDRRIRWLVRTARVPGNADEPNWSPDGKTIAFSADASLRGYPGGGIFLVSSDGRRVRRLTRGPDSSPAWSPDGRWIAFLRATKPQASIWVADVKTGRARRVGCANSVRRRSSEVRLV